MTDELQLLILGAIIGGFAGALFSAYIPRLLYDPRLKILGLEVQPSFGSYHIVVINGGRTAAINAVGHLTLRPIGPDSVLITRQQAQEAAESSDTRWWETGYWRKGPHSYLHTEDWQLGIESEHLFWATFPNPTQITLNPGLRQRLILAYSDGAWVDIASETPKMRRAKLKLGPETIYYGEIVIAAENCPPSKPFRFVITLGADGKAHIQPTNRPLPTR